MMTCVCCFSVFGQAVEKNHVGESVVGISPVRLWNGLRIKYEFVFSEKLTFGGTGTYYYGMYPGFQIAPTGRYYLKNNAPEGLYLQGKIVGGYYKTDWYTSEGEDTTKSFTNFGLGAAVGYQMLWGKNSQWSLDLNIGVKFVGNVPKWEDDEYGFASALDNATWYSTGPGSILDGLVSIGYRF